MIINLENTDGITAEGIKYNEGSVASALETVENELTANGTRIYLDYKDGKYGYNTDAKRGADTFNPFNSGGSEWELVTDNITPPDYTYVVGTIFEYNSNIYTYISKSLYRINVTTNRMTLLKSYTDLESFTPVIGKTNGNIYFNFTSGRNIYLFNPSDYSLTFVTNNESYIHTVFTNKYIYEIGSNKNYTGTLFRRYNPVDNTWTTLADTPLRVVSSNYKYGSAFTHNDEVYIQSGDTIYKYNEVTDVWSTFSTIVGGIWRDSYYKKYSVNNKIHLLAGRTYVNNNYYYCKTDIIYNERNGVFEYYSPSIASDDHTPISLYESDTYNYLMDSQGNKFSLYRAKR